MASKHARLEINLDAHLKGTDCNYLYAHTREVMSRCGRSDLTAVLVKRPGDVSADCKIDVTRCRHTAKEARRRARQKARSKNSPSAAVRSQQKPLRPGARLEVADLLFSPHQPLQTLLIYH